MGKFKFKRFISIILCALFLSTAMDFSVFADGGGQLELKVTEDFTQMATILGSDETNPVYDLSKVIKNAVDKEAVTYALKSGTLPDGIIFDEATGKIYGTPLKKDLGKEFSVVFSISDGNGDSKDFTFRTYSIKPSYQADIQPFTYGDHMLKFRIFMKFGYTSRVSSFYTSREIINPDSNFKASLTIKDKEGRTLRTKVTDSIEDGMVSFDIDSEDIDEDRKINYDTVVESDDISKSHGGGFITVAPKPLTPVLINSAGLSKEYDGTTEIKGSPQVQLSGAVGDDVPTLSDDYEAYFTDSDIGNNKEICLYGLELDPDNNINKFYKIDKYLWVTSEADINKKNIVITPRPGQWKYHDELGNSTLSYDATPLVDWRDRIEGNLTRTPGEEPGFYDYDISNLSADDKYNIILCDNPSKFEVRKYEPVPGESISPAAPDGKNGWYRTKVRITPPENHEISEDGVDWKDYLSMEEGKNDISYYLKSSTNYSTTEKISTEIRQDTVAPSMDDNFTVEPSGNIFESFMRWIFGNKEEKVSIGVSDGTSGINSVSYKLTSSDGVASEGTAEIQDGKAVVSVHNGFRGIMEMTASDKAGNTTTREFGLVLEDKAPETGITLDKDINEKGYTNMNVKATIKVSDPSVSSGLKEVSYVLVRDGVKGSKVVIFDGDISKVDKSTTFSLKDFSGSKDYILADSIEKSLDITEEGSYTLEVTSVDYAGNSSTKSGSFKIDKTVPVLDGVRSNVTFNDVTADFNVNENGRVYYKVKPAGQKTDTVEELLKDCESKEVVSGENSVTVNSLDGNTDYVFYMAVKDEAGNISSLESWNFKTEKEEQKITVVMDGNTEVPSDVFENLKGKDVELTIDMGNGYRWTVNGKDVTGDSFEDIDLKVILNSNNIDKNKVSKVAGNNDAIQMSLAHDGAFGFKATLSINLGSERAGQYANLFYDNPSSGELEYMSSSLIDEKGYTDLNFHHASDYLIVFTDKPIYGEKQGKLPQSGRPSNIPGLMVFFAAGAGLIYLGSKKSRLSGGMKN